MVYHKEEIEAANERAAARLSRTPTATVAHYDQPLGRVVIDLSSGLSIMFRPQDTEGLEQASPEQLSEIEISPSGLGLHFPAIDADIYLPSLLEGFLGSRQWMAARLGKAGGVSSLVPRPQPHERTASLAGGQRKLATQCKYSVAIHCPYARGPICALWPFFLHATSVSLLPDSPYVLIQPPSAASKTSN